MFNVFTYWEGDRPLYIQKCLNTIDNLSKMYKGISSVILTPENVDGFLKDICLHKNWKRLTKIAHRADCIRVAVMCKYGGLYVDADTVFIKSPLSLLDKLYKSNADLFYMKWNDGRILNGYFCCKKRSPIMIDWLDKINTKLSFIDERKYVWTEFGERILMPLVYNKHKNRTQEISRMHFLPVNIDTTPQIFFERVKLEGFLFDDVYAVGLNHSWFVDYKEEFVRIHNTNKLIDGDLLIHDIMREAIHAY